MTLSFGGGKRQLVVAAATIVLSLVLASCSGGSSSDGDTPAPAATTTTATPDQAAQDEAAVIDLAQRYWDAVVQAENTGNGDAAQFADVATSGVIEIELGQVAEYKDLKLLRVGKPAITDIEAAVTGDNAQVLLCKNEDGWTAEVDGQPVEGEEKFGNGSWGARAERVDGRWLIAEITPSKDSGKSCP